MPFRSLNILRLQRAGCRLLGSLALLSVFHVSGASGFLPDGGEASVVGSLAADQTAPAAAINSEGGFLVWQDTSGNSDGAVIRARRIGRTLAGSLPAFAVNSATNGLHECPKVALLADGGAVFVWRGGPFGKQGIFARFLRAGNTSTPSFYGADLEIAAAGVAQNNNPSVVRLADNSLVVTWDSYGSDGSLYGVLAQRLTSTGTKIGSPLQVNATVESNQRAAALAALANGGFAVAWVSENQRFDKSADIFARTFSAAGVALTGEMRLNTGTNICGVPSLVALPTGGFVAAWSEFDFVTAANQWDVYARAFDDNGVATLPSTRLNTYLPYNQLAPRLSIAGDTILAVWTSMNQDGFREGVFGRYLGLDAIPIADEFGLNQTVISQQKDPVVTSDGSTRFFTAWTSFVSVKNGFDLVSRKFARPASVAAVHCVASKLADSAGRPNGIKVSWQAVTGANYQLQRSDDLKTWENLAATQTVSDSTASVSLPLSQSGGFFRIVSLP